MDTIHLWQAFNDGSQIEDALLGTITLHQRKLGDLIISTGHIVACDPFVYPETPPFQMTLPPGCYPLLAYIASFATDNDHRIAYAQLQFSTQKPIRWEQAARIGQNIQSLKEDQRFGYPVDAGTACFMDSDAAIELQKRYAVDPTYVESLITYQDNLNVTLNSFTRANIMIFSSGWGDGFYTSYWGYDAEDNIACLVTDFALLDHPALTGTNRGDSDIAELWLHIKKSLLEWTNIFKMFYWLSF